MTHAIRNANAMRFQVVSIGHGTTEMTEQVLRTKSARRVVRALLGLCSIASVVAMAGPVGDPDRSPYAGLEARSIKSLSDEDLSELRRGGGWGLAKAAELNGVPGPAHLLELAEQIPLTAEQVEKIGAIFQQMQSRAIAEGERLIAGEQALEKAFRNRSIDRDSLRQMLTAIASSRSELRYVHLAAHLETLPLLTDEQVARYQELRGYGDDACADIPAGHDPAMWRRHHGCD